MLTALILTAIYTVSLLIFFLEAPKNEPTFYYHLYTNVNWYYKILTIFSIPLLLLIYFLLNALA